MKVKQQTRRNQRHTSAVSGESEDHEHVHARSPLCFESQTEAAEFLRERAVKRMIWKVKPRFKINDLEILCRRKNCAQEICESRGGLVDAQNVVNKAFSEPNVNMKIRLARAALIFDERCVDAHLILGEYAENRFTSREKHCHDAIEAGMHLWSQSTKPYLRALSALADHHKEHNLDEAIQLWERLLGLDSNNYTGGRQNYLSALLQANEPEKADGLLKRYPDDASMSKCLSDTDSSCKTEQAG